VVIGARGFIGGAITRHLAQEGWPNLALGRAQIDLLDVNAGDKLAAMLRPADALVMVSAQAPCKTPTMMLDNVRMAAVVCEAIASRPVDHVVYVSSDAVYADAPLPLSESAPAAPTTLHGAMHLAREHMLASVVGDTPFAILRPTLVYGAADPHNGYGPNRFRRLANNGEPIVLFGEGEERRDHVDVADIAAMTRLVLDHRSHGTLNIATGSVTSFRDVADLVVALSPNKVPIKGSPRVGPMPHNGYRPFDPAATFAAFPGFRYTPLAEGLARAQREEFA
jgi:nucleoside-diphosphate-sugar epimerase